MSADNWAQCPKCLAEAAEEIEAMEKNVRDAYGNVDVDTFDDMRNDLATLCDAQNEYNFKRTFREDYEFYGADEGALHISYRGGCTVCDCSLTIDETRKFYP